MEYHGPLYGKMGRRYIPLKMTSSDVDALVQCLSDAKKKQDSMQMELKQLHHTLRYNPLQLNYPPTL
jgi:hypothetical protein